MSIFIKLTGINGDVTSRGHENWLNATSINHTYHRAISSLRPGNTTDRNPGVPKLGEIEIVRVVDKASPLLFQHFCKAENISDGTIHLVKTNSSLDAYLQYSLKNILVSSIQRFHEGEGTPIEVLTLNYTKIEERYITRDSSQRAESPIIAGYDLQTAEVL